MTDTARRQSTGESLAYLALPFLLTTILSARHIPDVLAGELRNPDSYMRLARLRDSIVAGMPVHEIARDGSGGGTIVHWSHLLDSTLCLLALPFTFFQEAPAALHSAAALFGPLNVALLGLAVAWAATPFADRRWLWLAPLTICLGPAILPYGLVGVVHHHVPSVTVAVMVIGWGARIIACLAPPSAGWRMGAWAGLGVWLTPETLPLSVLAFGGLWLAWIWRPDQPALARAIANTGLGLAATVITAWAVNPPPGGYLMEDLDRVSLVFVALSVAIAGTGLLVRALDELVQPPITRLGWSVAGGGICALIWTTMFSPALLGTTAVIDDAATRAMFRDIAEMAPVSSVEQFLTYLLTGCLGTAALVLLAVRHRTIVLCYGAVVAIILVALGQMHLRFASYPEAVGAVMLPIVVTMWADRARAWPAWREPLPRMATILLFVLVPFAAEFSQSTRAARAETVKDDAACPVSGLGPMLRPYAGEVVLTDVNKSPELLYRTGIVTVGSLYHRNQSAFMRLRHAWRSTETDVTPVMFTVARVGYVLFCRNPGRSAMVADLPADTLLDRLARDEPPAWLHPVARDPESGHVLYRVGL